MARDKELDKLFGKKLRMIREIYGKIFNDFNNQTKFANKILGIEQNVISKYENGKLQIPLSVLLKLLHIDVNLTWFFDLDDFDNEAVVFNNNDELLEQVTFLDFINDHTIKKLNELLLKVPEEEREWLADYLTERIKKKKQV